MDEHSAELQSHALGKGIVGVSGRAGGSAHPHFIKASRGLQHSACGGVDNALVKPGAHHDLDTLVVTLFVCLATPGSLAQARVLKLDQLGFLNNCCQSVCAGKAVGTT